MRGGGGGANSLHFSLLERVVSCNGAYECVNVHGCGVRVCLCVCSVMHTHGCPNVQSQGVLAC